MQSELNLEGQIPFIAGRLTAADRLASQVGQKPTLLKHGRTGERIIQAILFFCGVVSIFTTLAIIVVLGSESLRLFTSTNFINTNKKTVQAITASDTTLHLETSGNQLVEGEVLILSKDTTPEQVRVVSLISKEEVVVERGINGTLAVPHPADTTLFSVPDISITEFIFSTQWAPEAGRFGILPLLNSTLMTTFIAMLVAVPVGLGTAIFLSEYASARTRAFLKPILELLAGIPTVVFGYFALTFMTPLLRVIFGVDTVPIYNVGAAGIVMGFMIVPTISSMSEDALSAVPRALREASYGLGATRLETIFKVLLPAALSGILAAFILGVSRAVGETMIVAVAAGAGPATELFVNPFQAAETITGHIARISTGDLSFGSIQYNSVFALGLALFILTLILNVISGVITRRFREVYT